MNTTQLQVVPKSQITSEVKRLLDASEYLQAGNWAELTKYGYENDWKKFIGFCADFGFKPLPATDETIAAFAAWCIEIKGYKVNSVARWIAAINYKHVSNRLEKPPSNKTRAVIHGARRILKQRPRGRSPLTIDQLKEICILLVEKGDDQCLRDRAILVVGFAAALRESSIINLELSDIRFHREGLIVTERSSKTDQEGIGRDVGIYPGKCAATCPVRAVKDWITVRGEEPGPLFFAWPFPIQNTEIARRHLLAAITARNATRQGSPRRRKSDLNMGRGYVSKIVKRCVQLIGLDPTTYGSHSLRAGCATAAAEFGASEYEIARRTGHRDLEMVRRYVRPTQAFAKIDPLRGNL